MSAELTRPPLLLVAPLLSLRLFPFEQTRLDDARQINRQGHDSAKV
jgi:hypothetical protein